MAVARSSERQFGIEELFFSITDRKGMLQASNDVFVRVSAYSPEELRGAPHSVIRHPDMPRTVFKLLWDTIGEGKPMVAYVKNRAKDGAHYWVVALVFRVQGGYLSIRLKPSTPMLQKVDQIYRALRAIEIAAGDKGENRATGMAEGAKELARALLHEGFVDYESFMHFALSSELLQRDKTLAERSGAPGREPSPRENDAPVDLSAAYQVVGKRLQTLFTSLDGQASVSQLLSEKSAYVLEFAQRLRLISLNSAIGTASMGQQGQALGAIAEHLEGSARSIRDFVTLLTGQVDLIVAARRANMFNIAIARLQLEMLSAFSAEQGKSESAAASLGDSERSRRFLHLAVTETLKLVESSATAVYQKTTGIAQIADDISKVALVVNFSQISGLIESSRVGANSKFDVVFRQIRAELEKALVELKELATVIRRLGVQEQFVRTTSAEIVVRLTQIESKWALVSEAS